MAEKKKENRLGAIINRIAALPEVLQKKIILLLMIGVGVAILSFGMAISLKNYDILIGLVIAVFLIYNALNIVSAYEKGKVICRKVLCIGVGQNFVQAILQKDKVSVVFRDLEPIDGVVNTYEMNVTVSKRQRGLICQNAVMNIYFWANIKYELIAWEVVDFRQPEKSQASWT